MKPRKRFLLYHYRQLHVSVKVKDAALIKPPTKSFPIWLTSFIRMVFKVGGNSRFFIPFINLILNFPGQVDSCRNAQLPRSWAIHTHCQIG